MSFSIQSVTLDGKYTRLRPLKKQDRDALLHAASDGQLWKLWFTSVPSAETIDAYIDTALTGQKNGVMLPFVVEDIRTGAVIGCTRYCNIDEANNRLEIGFTWYAQSYQRTATNTECKVMLLSHAFETLECMAVEFRTHHANLRSQKAIERLGATRDGILRQHKIMPDGTTRDTYVYSIIDSEWPEIKTKLLKKLL